MDTQVKPAGQPTMQAAPQEEHLWLQQLVGEWTSVAEITMAPGDPPETCRSTESIRSLGGLWIVA